MKTVVTLSVLFSLSFVGFGQNIQQSSSREVSKELEFKQIESKEEHDPNAIKMTSARNLNVEQKETPSKESENTTSTKSTSKRIE